MKSPQVESPNQVIYRLCSYAWMQNRCKPLRLYCLPYRLGTPAVNMGFSNHTTEFQFGNVSKKLIDKFFTKSIPPTGYTLPSFSEGWPIKDQFTHLLCKRSSFNEWQSANKIFLHNRCFTFEILRSQDEYFIAKINYN